MGYLRLVRNNLPTRRTENACLEAFDRELDYLFATFRRLGASPTDIEDLVQEVFLVLRRNWPEMDTSLPLRPYLFGVAFRIVAAHRRRRVREVPSPGLDPEDLGSNPEERLQDKQAVSVIMAALKHVPLPRRAVIVMHDLDGIPVAEIAQALSITRFGAHSRLRKGHKELAAAVRRLLRERSRR